MEKDKGRFYRLKWFWNILRNGLFWFGLRNRLANIGLDIDPYYWELEGLELATAPEIKGDPGAFKLEYLSLEEIRELSGHIHGLNRDLLLSGIEGGQKCIGLRHAGGKIAAYMMIETRAYNYKKRCITLKPNEAYLLGMYTYEDFRGMNLAPYLRYKSYKLLKDEGRDRLYSITAYFNKSSLKFKRKLGAKHLSLQLYIGLFNKLERNFVIKRYRDTLQVPADPGLPVHEEPLLHNRN